MIPHTYPTFVDARKQGYMRVFFLTSVTGLTKWVDYIPVKTVAFSAANEGTTNANGHMTVMQVASRTALAAWRDYVPVFEDGSATVAWSSGSNGYIPVCQALNLDFTAPILDSRITFTRADATSCATYFDSTGRLATAAANVARFDYDPATPAGVTGGNLNANGFASGWTGTGWTFGSTAVATATTNAAVRLATVTVGKTYTVTIVCSNYTSGSYKVLSEGGYSLFGDKTSAGTFTATYTAQATGGIYIWANTSLTAEFSSLTIQEATFTPRGLLIEESRTNLLLQSRDMTNAAWTKTDVTPTRNQVGIDGTANSACLMTEGSAGTAKTQQSATVTAGATVTASAVFKRGNTDWLRIRVWDGANGCDQWVNVNTGAKGSTTAIGTSTNNSGAVLSLGGGWYRVSVTSTPSGGYTVPFVDCSSASADNSATRVSGATYIVDAAQLEVGSFATSPIITQGSTVQRQADSASMTGSNFSSWFNASAGTFVVEYDYQSSSGRVMATGPTSVGAYIAIGAPNGATTGWFASGVSAIGASVGATIKRAIAYTSSGAFDACTGGGAVQTSASSDYTGTGTNALYLGGNAGGNNANGHIRRLTYYPTRLTNAQLQSLTS